MSEQTSERKTDDPIDPQTLQADVTAMLDTIVAGGVAIVPLDVAYAVNSATSDGIKRIFDAKNRSYEKPSGMFANYQMSRDIHLMDDWKHDLVETIIEKENIPFSVVAPFDEGHEFFSKIEPFVLQSSSMAGTLDMLLNAGQFHNEVARQAWERGVPVFGSSANTSLAGSKYRYEDIEEPVRNAASIHFDYGLSKYANPAGRSSTIIDFRDFTVIRVGVIFDRVRETFKKYGNVDLIINENTAGHWDE
jgi:tRNA A37 threonylcarbamoyladenosine synthetase subunit TsaC/SUA5/YrdC